MSKEEVIETEVVETVGTEEELDTTSQSGAEEKKKEEVKTFTQEQVTAMMAKEKNQGKKSAITELGFKDEKSAKAALASYNKFLQSQKTEEEIATEKNNQIAQEKMAAENRAIIAEAKVEVMILGAKPDCIDDVIALAMNKKTDDNDFKTIVEELKTKYPSFFIGEVKDTEEEKKKVGKKGTGGNVSNVSSSKDEKSLGARLAAQKKVGAKKSSYFDK